MRSPRNIRISLPSQAATVIGFTALWYVSLWLGLRAGKGFISNLSLFWGAAFFYSPIIAAVFAVILLASHFRTGQSHRWLVYTAVLIAITPWICFSLFTN